MSKLVQSFKKNLQNAGKAVALTSALVLGTAGLSSAFAQEALFYEKDFSDREVRLVQIASEKVSNKLGKLPSGNVTFLVYGGNDKLVGIAHKVAKRLQSEGIHIGFIQAGVSHTLDKIMDVEFYTRGGTQYNIQVFDNEHITEAQSESDIYNLAKEAYEQEYGIKVTKKSQSDDAIVQARYDLK